MRLAALFMAIGLAACNGGDDTDTDLGTDPGTEPDTEVGTEADTEPDTEQGDIELLGDWTDNFGTHHTITNTEWVQAGSFLHSERRFVGGGFSSTFHIESYDNAVGYVIAQNDADDAYNPSLYSRFDWAVNGDGAFVYCQSAFDAATAADAELASADDSDLAAGCGGFSWSLLTEAAGVR